MRSTNISATKKTIYVNSYDDFDIYRFMRIAQKRSG